MGSESKRPFWPAVLMHDGHEWLAFVFFGYVGKHLPSSSVLVWPRVLPGPMHVELPMLRFQGAPTRPALFLRHLGLELFLDSMAADRTQDGRSALTLWLKIVPELDYPDLLPCGYRDLDFPTCNARRSNAPGYLLVLGDHLGSTHVHNLVCVSVVCFQGLSPGCSRLHVCRDSTYRTMHKAFVIGLLGTILTHKRCCHSKRDSVRTKMVV